MYIKYFWYIKLQYWVYIVTFLYKYLSQFKSKIPFYLSFCILFFKFRNNIIWGMKIKDIWNKFLELRKSPVCFLFSFIGLLCVFSFLYIEYLMYAPTFLLKNMFFYFIFRICCKKIVALAQYFPVVFLFWLSCFLMENLFKIKLKSDFFINNNIYKFLWFIGFTAFIFILMFLPIIDKTWFPLKGY